MTLPISTPEAPRRFSLRAKVALLASTLLLLLLLDVAAAHVYRRITGHCWLAGNPARAYRIPVDPYHHRLRPNYSTDTAKWRGDYPLRTNSLGFRDATVREVKLSPAGQRIVVIGDSFTEGVGVPYEQTFPGRIGTALAPLGVEVLDAGVQSYTPIIHYRKVRHLLEDVGLRFDELIVALDLTDVRNEHEYELVDDVVRSRRFRDRAEATLRQNSIVVYTIAAFLFRERGRSHGTGSAREAAGLGSDAAIEAALRNVPGVRGGNWPHDEKLYREYGEAGVKLMIGNMDRLLSVLRARGMRLTVVVYPWPAQIVAGDTDCKHVSVWRGWCRENGVRFVDASPKFEVGCSWRRRAEILDACYIPGDSHFNAEGHRRVAEAILEAIPETPVPLK